MEAVSPDGYTYYYNSQTGGEITIADFICFWASFWRDWTVITIGASCLTESSWEKPADFPSNEDSGSSREDESQEEPSAPEPGLLSGGESSNGAPAPQEDEVPEEPKQQPKVPKISFRVRAEKLVEIVGKDIPELIFSPLF